MVLVYILLNRNNYIISKQMPMFLILLLWTSLVYVPQGDGGGDTAAGGVRHARCDVLSSGGRQQQSVDRRQSEWKCSDREPSYNSRAQLGHYVRNYFNGSVNDHCVFGASVTGERYNSRSVCQCGLFEVRDACVSAWRATKLWARRQRPSTSPWRTTSSSGGAISLGMDTRSLAVRILTEGFHSNR